MLIDKKLVILQFQLTFIKCFLNVGHFTFNLTLRHRNVSVYAHELQRLYLISASTHTPSPWHWRGPKCSPVWPHS